MKVGVYQLCALLSSSEVGSRYRAVDVRSDATVEVVLLRYEAADSQLWRETCKRLQTAALIDSPVARRIEELEFDGHQPFLALESLEGPTLGQWLEAEGCRWEPRAACEFILGLGLGVAAAQGLGFVHGGLRPAVIQQRASLEPFSPTDWTIDFSAAALPRQASRPDDDALFVPPEATRGELEPGSDVFGLAALLQKVLWDGVSDLAAGTNGDEFDAALAAHGTELAVRKTLASLLLACSAVDPADRPELSEFTARLRSLVGQLDASDSSMAMQLAKTGDSTGELPSHSALDKTAASGQDVQPPSTLSLPTQLGRFRLTAKLGEGGMGAVYRGEDLADGTAVAVKVLGAGAVDNPVARRRFAKEARMLARITSPYVAKLFEFNDEGGTDYLVTEFVAGSNLAELLAKLGTVSEASALAVMSDICRGLAAAHGRGIVHRDVKPDNILLTEVGRQWLAATNSEPVALPLAKLSDFGLARTANQSESLAITRQGAVMGTPYYMSPEQCRGEPTDERSDVYSMGATLFHLLAGQPPFHAETHVGVLHKHCNDPIPSLTQLKPELGSGLESVIHKALAKNPDARYANADAMLVDLENLRHGQATSLGLHPQLPTHDQNKTVAYTFSWSLTSSPAQLWPFVSNTDRLNQAIGLPPARFTTRVDPIHGVRRFAETRIAGQHIAWEEHPYEWIEGRRMSILREFSRGPFEWFVSIVELLPQTGGGTKLVHTVMMQPRSVLGRVIAHVEIGWKASRALQRAYLQVDGFIASGKQHDPTADPFRKPATLSGRRRNRLQQRLERVRDHEIEPTVIDTLGQFLEHASDQEVSRIRPKAFAARFDLDAAQVIHACLRGTHEGLLVLLWDILCPSCQIPANVQESLAALESHGHCEACNVDFELDFSNSIEMIFRAHPEIRDVEVRTYCIGGPSFSAHVVAQTRIAAGERFQIDAALPEGAYRLRGPQLPYAVDLRIGRASGVGRWEIALSKPPPREVVPVLKIGAQVITLLNDGQTELLVRLERVASRHDAVTAADASSLRLFRELLPDQVLAAGQMVSAANISLLSVQLDRAADLYAELGDGEAFAVIRRGLVALEDAITVRGGAVVKFVAEGMLATFNDPAKAAVAAFELPQAVRQVDDKQRLDVRIALHSGPALVTVFNDRLDYFGATVHATTRLLELACPGDVMTTQAITSHPEISRLIRRQGWQVEVVADSEVPDPALAGLIAQRCSQAAATSSL